MTAAQRTAGSASAEPTAEVTDSALIERMRLGDRDALALLYGRHAATMLALAYRVLHDRQECEDLIHDVLLEAWQRCAEYSEERGNVRAWLLMRTRSRALDRVRSRSRRTQATLAPPANESQQRSTQTDAGLLDRQRLPAALAQIPESQQHVIVLSYFEGLSTLEIASRLGIPTGTVKSRTHAAIATLRGVLGVSDD